VGLIIAPHLAEPFRRWWWLSRWPASPLFSPVQYQVFLWLILHQVTCLLFFLTAGILVWMTRWPLCCGFVSGSFVPCVPR